MMREIVCGVWGGLAGICVTVAADNLILGFVVAVISAIFLMEVTQ